MYVVTPATTSITAFIGAASTGDVDQAKLITRAPSANPFVDQFFACGGTQAWSVPLVPNDPDFVRAFAALDAAPSLNLIAAPPIATMSGPAYADAVAQITAYAVKRRAFFIVDPPSDWTDVTTARDGVSAIASIVAENGAVYWPPLTTGSASPAVAGVYAGTDASTGVWKAPAGLKAVLPGLEPVTLLNDVENGVLNPLAVNCIRVFPNAGTVVWGARTLAGAQTLDSDWKYVSVRRLAVFLESSIAESFAAIVDQPNGPALWSGIGSAVSSFLNDLWRQGAFFGATASQAFFVQCDATTTTQDDIDNGRLNVVIGIAPVKPAEYVVLRIGLWAARP